MALQGGQFVVHAAALPGAVLARESHQALAHAMQQFGVGREGDRLRLHRGVDNDAGEIRGLGCPQPIPNLYDGTFGND
jgi:hypothetical protein